MTDRKLPVTDQRRRASARTRTDAKLMLTDEPVLVPTDGSDQANRAAAFAFEMGAESGATVHVLHVVEPVASAFGAAGPDLPTTLERTGVALQRAAEEAIGSVGADAAKGGVETESAVRRGVVHETILEYAAEHDLGLIVMSTRGATGLDRIFVGSVTERVVRMADVPVLVV